MSYDEKRNEPRLREQLQERSDEPTNEEHHVVFDFTGLDRPNVGDLALVLTARLGTAPGDSVWVRSIPWQTQRILEVLHLDHLFRQYPEGEGDLN